MRTLLMQVYEGGRFHENAVTQKRGLYNALAARGAIHDFDYLANDPATLLDGVNIRMDYFQPDLVLTQFHAPNVLSPAQIRDLKARYPNTKWVNWSGDSWAWSLTSPAMLELAKAYDLWLVAAPDVLPIYAEHGINAAFWQIGWEPSVIELPTMPTYDIVFMGNVISEKRRALIDFLRDEIENKYTVGIYGDWEHSNGHNTYAFAEGESLYRNATLAIADHAYPDQAAYISNRPFQVLGAGGALLLHQRVERMDVLSGLEAGKHYAEWDDFDELKMLIEQWMQPTRAHTRKNIVRAGRKFVLKEHSYERRVEQLLELLGEWQP